MASSSPWALGVRKIATRHHYSALRKRYRQIDYVAEFRNHWAQFNAWFNKEIGANTDRDAIQALKQHEVFRQTIKSLAITRTDQLLRHSHRYSRDYMRYRTRTVISDFVQAAFTNQRFTKSLNLFNQRGKTRARDLYHPCPVGTVSVHTLIPCANGSAAAQYDGRL